MHNPEVQKYGIRGVTSMSPKAWRWEPEMREIEACHEEDGGFVGSGNGLFASVAEIYRTGRLLSRPLDLCLRRNLLS